MREHTAGTTPSRTALVGDGLGMLLALSACAWFPKWRGGGQRMWDGGMGARDWVRLSMLLPFWMAFSSRWRSLAAASLLDGPSLAAASLVTFSVITLYSLVTLSHVHTFFSYWIFSLVPSLMITCIPF